MSFKEFHINKRSRLKFGIDTSIFSQSGRVILADFYQSQLLAHKINEVRRQEKSELFVRAGHLNALGLINEIYHFLFEIYREQIDHEVFKELQAFYMRQIGEAKLNKLQIDFVEQFPPKSVYNLQETAEAYIKKIENQETCLEELILLWINNQNRAASSLKELFDDSVLLPENYFDFSCHLETFFKSRPPFGVEKKDLLTLLLEPLRLFPDSLFEQLKFIWNKWGNLLEKFALRILRVQDLLREEEKPHPTGIEPHVPLYSQQDYEAASFEPEKFSPDLDWMPRLVLIAKSVYVWLDQLSKKYSRSINRLDQIPDEELDQLANWGFTGLWLIGVWQRSQASRKIKQIMGNNEALASAYSLEDYRIASELGGEEALLNLKSRAIQRGIRLAADMVPNHMGIDSRWVYEHPDWFIQLPYSPFPAYSFNGENLSRDSAYGIFIEDHYYNRTDAAVVFKFVDYKNGVVRYIYHGNDGTSTPWNDTAQLNYLLPEVRAAVKETICYVASLFPIIRFDAAMTLTKRHYQRLWFPVPGTGGDIPSRSEHGLTKKQFDQMMPEEFWREVVDMIAQRAPDTLLLAEAFWLMENYFVRSLGMHRVYNSAFMNFLKKEENQKFRYSLKSVLEFNPEILRRYVNFMNNPDEDTAINQFGKDDKYFGVCTLLVTLPGLPMFGHGQIEGFREKYGMEYARAYWDEKVDWDLVRRHEREIFPLLKKRYLFAGVNNFVLYDFFSPEGFVNENVIAFTNSAGSEKVLIIYNNCWERTAGWLRYSVAQNAYNAEKQQRELTQFLLGSALQLRNHYEYFTIFRDPFSNLEFIRSNKELYEKGFYYELNGYQKFVFLQITELYDQDCLYSKIYQLIGDKPVQSVEDEIRRTFFKPVEDSFAVILCRKAIAGLLDYNYPLERFVGSIQEVLEKYYQFCLQLQTIIKKEITWSDFFTDLIQFVKKFIHRNPSKFENYSQSYLYFLRSFFTYRPGRKYYFLLFLEMKALLANFKNDYQLLEKQLNYWRIMPAFNGYIEQLKKDQSEIFDYELLALLLEIDEEQLRNPHTNLANLINQLLTLKRSQKVIRVNTFAGEIWFNKEAFQELTSWIYILQLYYQQKKISLARAKKLFNDYKRLNDFALLSNFRLQKLQALLAKEPGNRK